MSDCRLVAERLADFLVDALDADESARVAAHVETCSRCGRELAELGALEETLRAEDREPAIVDFLRFLRDEPRWWLVPALIVLAALASVIVFAEGSAIAPFIYSIF